MGNWTEYLWEFVPSWTLTRERRKKKCLGNSLYFLLLGLFSLLPPLFLLSYLPFSLPICILPYIFAFLPPTFVNPLLFCFFRSHSFSFLLLPSLFVLYLRPSLLRLYSPFSFPFFFPASLFLFPPFCFSFLISFLSSFLFLSSISSSHSSFPPYCPSHSFLLSLSVIPILLSSLFPFLPSLLTHSSLNSYSVIIALYTFVSSFLLLSSFLFLPSTFFLRPSPFLPSIIIPFLRSSPSLPYFVHPPSFFPLSIPLLPLIPSSPALPSSSIHVRRLKFPQATSIKYTSIVQQLGLKGAWLTSHFLYRLQ